MAKSIAWGHTHLPSQLGIQSGVTDVFRVEGNATADYSVAFETPFAVVPTVVVGYYSTSTDPKVGGLAVALMTANENGFTVRAFNSDSSARLPQVGWIAVGFEQPKRPAAQLVMVLDGGRLNEAILG